MNKVVFHVLDRRLLRTRSKLPTHHKPSRRTVEPFFVFNDFLPGFIFPSALLLFSARVFARPTWRRVASPAGSEPSGTWREAWRALEELHRQGKVRALGVSNFSPQELEELVGFAQVKPAVVQSHSDPLRQNAGLQRACASHGIVFTAYSSLGTQHGGGRPNPVLNHPVVLAIASRLHKSPAQVVLRWALDHNQVSCAHAVVVGEGGGGGFREGEWDTWPLGSETRSLEVACAQALSSCYE